MSGHQFGRKGGGVVTTILATFALLMQLMLAPACAQAEPAHAAAPAHCQPAAHVERSDAKQAPATTANPCCKCVAATVALTPAPVVALAPPEKVAAECAGSPAAPAPTLRAIASGPPAQAPPVSI